MRGLPYDRNQLFLYAFLKVSPRLIPQGNDTLQTSTPSHDIHGKQSVLVVCIQEEQVKTNNIVEYKEIG